MPMPAWVTTATRRADGRDDPGQLVAHAVADEHVVGAVGQRDGDDDHAAASRCSTAAMTWATTSATGREESTTTSATSA